MSEKMNIAIAWNGQGYGHFRRLQPIIEHLSKKHSLLLFVPGGFEKVTQKYDVKKQHIPSYRFSLDENTLKRWKTFTKNLPLLSEESTHVDHIERSLRANNIEALIVDYERLTSLAASNLGLPTLAFSHQAVFYDDFFTKFTQTFKHINPADYVDALTAYIATAGQIPYATQVLSSSFYEGDVGGLIRPSLLDGSRTQEGPVPVYSKNPQLARSFAKKLRTYGYEAIAFDGSSEASYEETLRNAPFAISTAGHQTCVECIALHKPLLAIPQDNQFEQLLNAVYLQRSGKGMWVRKEAFDEKLPEFLRFVQEGPREPDQDVNWLFGDYTSQTLARVGSFLEHVRANSNTYKQ